jgi:peptidoglycan/xylan/chitin deacetylase (PgdA/CDA1 family)
MKCRLFIQFGSRNICFLLFSFLWILIIEGCHSSTSSLALTDSSASITSDHKAKDSLFNLKKEKKESQSLPVEENLEHSIDTNNIAVQPIDSLQQYIYLTFDDGPQPGTLQCVKAIKDLNVTASFFMVGMHAYDNYLKKEVDSIRHSNNCIIANHSFSHAFKNKYKLFYSHPQSALSDFLKAQEILHIPFKICRLPGNSAWVLRKRPIVSSKQTRAVCKLLDSAGYSVIGWDVEWNFKKDSSGKEGPVQSVSTMVKMVENTFRRHETHTRNHIVILAHDRMFLKPAYTDSLVKFIALLKSHPSYVFETVNHYPGVGP